MATFKSSKRDGGIKLHGRTYAFPRAPTVIVCVDGFDPTYLEEGIKAGILPTLQSFVSTGFHTTAQSCMPSFTNPNNVSIITGQPPSIHGIAGNYFLDPKTKKEHMITDDSLLRGSTILDAMYIRGVRVAAVTAKDKLRRILSHGISGTGAICFSAERAASCSIKENGIADVEKWIGRAQPSQYSGDLSLFVLDAGIKILQEKRAELLYLTLSDFIQHKYAPGQKESDEFLAALDRRLKALVDLGAVVAVTGDHGMSDKSLPDGKPNVLFLEDELTARFGKGSARVICPITDPFVRHHGALGSFVRVYLESPWEHLQPMLDYVRTFPQVQVAMSGEVAALIYELPLDREGHLIVISKKNAVIGSREDEHDLSNLGEHGLRSHGGLSERNVPLILSRPILNTVKAKGKDWKNYDIFDLALNW